MPRYKSKTPTLTELYHIDLYDIGDIIRKISTRRDIRTKKYITSVDHYLIEEVHPDLHNPREQPQNRSIDPDNEPNIEPKYYTCLHLETNKRTYQTFHNYGTYVPPPIDKIDEYNELQKDPRTLAQIEYANISDDERADQNKAAITEAKDIVKAFQRVGCYYEKIG